MDLGGVTWIVAADGVQSRVFEERRRSGEVVERAEYALRADPKESRSHRHGATVHSRFGFGRSMAGERAWRDERAARFLRQVAASLDQAVLRRRFDRLVLIAPPRALGLLKEALSEATAERLDATDPHDCVRERREAIRARLRAIRASA